MAEIRTHRDLDVWKMSVDFAIDIYKITSKFPKEETFSLSIQMKRAGISICSNIAEGAGRIHPGEFIQFLNIAQGSLSELDTQFEIAFRLKYIKNIEKETLTIKQMRLMIRSLIMAIQAKSKKK